VLKSDSWSHPENKNMKLKEKYKLKNRESLLGHFAKFRRLRGDYD